MNPATDPSSRAVSLTALCKAYLTTEWTLLERVIAILQRDTRAWLRIHPEHVHAFCDAFYDRRDEINTLAADVTGQQNDDNTWLNYNGIWTILGKRYETKRAHDARMKDAGYSSWDIDTAMKELFTEEELQNINAKNEALIQKVKKRQELGLDEDDPMNYLFWFPGGHPNSSSDGHFKIPQ